MESRGITRTVSEEFSYNVMEGQSPPIKSSEKPVDECKSGDDHMDKRKALPIATLHVMITNRDFCF